MRTFSCPNCRLKIPLRDSEFPFFCRCGYVAREPLAMEQFAIDLLPAPLSQKELDRRLSICHSCDKFFAPRESCAICKTCGSGVAVYQALLRDPTKTCPYPEFLGGSKWGSAQHQPLKVAFLSPGLNCGGAERWLISLAQKFDQEKIWVQAVGVELSRNIVPIMQAELPKHVRVVSEWDNIQAVAKQVDFLIVWGSTNMVEAARVSGKPFVTVIHGATEEQSSFSALIARAGIAAGSPMAAVNEACLASFPKDRRKEVTIIPNGADENRVTFSLERFTSYEHHDARCYLYDELQVERLGQKILLYIGRVSKDKDIRAMVEAAELLPPEWIFVIAGPHGNQTFGPRVKFLAPRNHVGDLLAAANVQILLSPSEAHPLSITEGWLAGVPTVVSDLPWIRAIHAQHGAMSWTVDRKASPDQVAARILEADASGRGSEQVLFAQETARLEYTAEVMARRWEEYILSLVASSPRDSIALSGKAP